MTKDWSVHCSISCISSCTLYMQVREMIWLSPQLEMKFRNKLWVVFKTSIKEFCPRVPKDVIDWRIVVSWIVIFVINVCTCDFFFLLFLMYFWVLFIYISNLLWFRRQDWSDCKIYIYINKLYKCIYTDISSWNNKSITTKETSDTDVSSINEVG